jgi:hypothetical protein
VNYEVIPRPREETEPLAEGEAMRRAIISAMTGQGALVLREDGALLWEMKVVRMGDRDRLGPVTVHFRGEPESAGLPF